MSPCPRGSDLAGMTIDESNGDVLIVSWLSVTSYSIYRYSKESQLITVDLAFSNVNNVSSDGIVSDQTNPGTISNIRYHNGYLYMSTSTKIRRLEKISETEYYLRTIVGTSLPGYTGDRLPALKSALDNPVAFYVKNNGDIIILDGGGVTDSVTGENNIIRRYEKQSGLLIDFAGKPESKPKYNGDGKGLATVFMSFTKQVEVDESSGEIYFIDSRLYIRKMA